MKQMLKRFYTPLFVITMMFAGMLGLAATTAPALAQSPLDATCGKDGLGASEICKNRSDKLFGENSFWTRLINTLIYIIGAIAVLMMVIGGLRYVISGGDASQTKSAKDTILYAIVGVVIALMAYAIVNFVVVNLV